MLANLGKSLASVLVVTLMLLSRANGTTLLIVTDQTKAPKAQEVANLFRTTAPFSLMKDLNIKVIQTSPTKLGCNAAPFTVSAQSQTLTQDSIRESNLLAKSEWHPRTQQGLITESLPDSCNQSVTSKSLSEESTTQGSTPIARLISCETPKALRYLAALGKTEKAKYIVVAVTDSRYGGSGGSYPVITTASPASMAIHELLHQLGFADEYSYINACEADMYCGRKDYDSKSPSGYGLLPGSAFNVAAFNALPNYSSSDSARKKHAKAIPWLSFIAAATDLVNAGQLGTKPKSGEVGLFRSNICDKATKRIDTWLPTTEVTIMQSLSTTYIPNAYWPTIAKSLGTTITN